MDDTTAFMELSALLTGLPELHKSLVKGSDEELLNKPIAEEYVRRLRGTFPGGTLPDGTIRVKFSALVDAYITLASVVPKPPIDDALLDKLRATQAFKDNEIVAKQIVNVWYFSQFNDEAVTLRDGGFYERGYVWPLIGAHPIGFSKQLHGYWTRKPAKEAE
jgi:hypothetical protein